MNIIGAVPYQAFPSIGYAISAVQSGKMSIPVSPSAYIYSHFKHVSGVPAPEGVSGLSISKLKIIDTLIEQLSRMKKQPETSNIYTEEKNSEMHTNALIEKYNNEIRNTQTASASNPYAPAMPFTGAIFSISV